MTYVKRRPPKAKVEKYELEVPAELLARYRSAIKTADDMGCDVLDQEKMLAAFQRMVAKIEKELSDLQKKEAATRSTGDAGSSAAEAVQLDSGVAADPASETTAE